MIASVVAIFLIFCCCCCCCSSSQLAEAKQKSPTVYCFTQSGSKTSSSLSSLFSHSYNNQLGPVVFSMTLFANRQVKQQLAIMTCDSQLNFEWLPNLNYRAIADVEQCHHLKVSTRRTSCSVMIHIWEKLMAYFKLSAF